MWGMWTVVRMTSFPSFSSSFFYYFFSLFLPAQSAQVVKRPRYEIYMTSSTWNEIYTEDGLLFFFIDDILQETSLDMNTTLNNPSQIGPSADLKSATAYHARVRRLKLVFRDQSDLLKKLKPILSWLWL